MVKIALSYLQPFFDWSTRVTDGETDGQTDVQAIAYSALSIYVICCCALKTVSLYLYFAMLSYMKWKFVITYCTYNCCTSSTVIDL